MALVSKVNALMRRLSKVQAQIMSSGEITVHMKTMQVYKGDEPVTLSKKEFSLLLYLWENAGQIVSKESILEHVWDIDGQFIDDNTVIVNISRLKNKLGTEEIANVRGLGYIWTGKVNKIKRYFIVYVIFAVFFTVGMYLITKYEENAKSNADSTAPCRTS